MIYAAYIAIAYRFTRQGTPFATASFIYLGLGCAFAGWRHVSAWTAAAGPATGTAPGNPDHPAVTAAPWLLLGALALTGISLLTAL